MNGQHSVAMDEKERSIEQEDSEVNAIEENAMKDNESDVNIKLNNSISWDKIVSSSQDRTYNRTDFL